MATAVTTGKVVVSPKESTRRQSSTTIQEVLVKDHLPPGDAAKLRLSLKMIRMQTIRPR